MASRRQFLLSLAAPALAANTPGFEMIEAPGDWPRWRGPSGQGEVSGGGYPDTWSDTQNVAWKTPLNGQGNSSPIVWGDRIFITAAYESGQRRSIQCFDRANGKLLWETFAAPGPPPERAHRKNGYASGTPATEGERIYAFLGNHGLLCTDLHGGEVWSRSLGALNAYHGTACSPLLYQDHVILLQDHRGSGGSFVAAYSKKTGEEIWRTSRQARVGWCSPVAVRAGGQDQIIISGHTRVIAYNPADGKELWSCKGNLVEVIPTPVTSDGLLFCCSGRAGPTLAIRSGGSGDVTSTHLAWRSSKGSPFIPSPVAYQGRLYMVNDMASVATCYQAATGKVLWQGRLGEPRSHGFSASGVAFDGKVYFSNDNGETYVLAAGDEFRILAVNRMNERMLASPALVDGKWYFRTAGHLVSVG